MQSKSEYVIVCFSPDTFNFLDIGTVNKLVLTKGGVLPSKYYKRRMNELGSVRKKYTEQTVNWVTGGDKNRRKDRMQNLDDSGQAASRFMAE